VGYQSKTYSLSDEVVDAIERAKAGGTTPNRFLRELMGLNGGESVAGEAEQAHVSAVPAGAPTGKYDPSTVPGVTKGVPPPSGIPTRCEHCGVKFESESRRNRRCPGCEEAGHAPSRDCEECRLASL
jgi:hypothetical protein